MISLKQIIGSENVEGTHGSAVKVVVLTALSRGEISMGAGVGGGKIQQDAKKSESSGYPQVSDLSY